jgi:hypothetical protein
MVDGLPENWISVDPGDKNVGVTRWLHDRPIRAIHTNPDQFVDHLWKLLFEAGDRPRLDLVVYERFQLDGKRMGPQIGSSFATPGLIYTMYHLTRRAGVDFVGYLPGHHKQLYRLPDYKPPIKSHRAWVSYGHGPHAKDSECLGLYHIRRLTLKGMGY